MTAANLSRLLLHSAAVLVLVGLVFSEFVGAPRTGMVLAMVGLIAYGGAGVASYLAWEHDE